MNKSITKTLTLLHTLQRAPESVRKKWLVGVSAAAMALVVIGWVFSLNVSLAPLSPRETLAEKPGTFFETLGKGFEVFGATFSELWTTLRGKGEFVWSALGAQLANPVMFSFVREAPLFMPTPADPVPPQTLPVSD
ncbi:MAG: hypothetical protein Q8P88_01635 [Candidatus Jorgensenbacteria bacterium]|nr:hypothetical protein [Candidatus Jorgensenbacteria bacterium]